MTDDGKKKNVVAGNGGDRELADLAGMAAKWASKEILKAYVTERVAEEYARREQDGLTLAALAKRYEVHNAQYLKAALELKPASQKLIEGYAKYHHQGSMDQLNKLADQWHEVYPKLPKTELPTWLSSKAAGALTSALQMAFYDLVDETYLRWFDARYRADKTPRTATQWWAKIQGDEPDFVTSQSKAAAAKALAATRTVKKSQDRTSATGIRTGKPRRPVTDE